MSQTLALTALQTVRMYALGSFFLSAAATSATCSAKMSSNRSQSFRSLASSSHVTGCNPSSSSSVITALSSSCCSTTATREHCVFPRTSGLQIGHVLLLRNIFCFDYSVKCTPFCGLHIYSGGKHSWWNKWLHFNFTNSESKKRKSSSQRRHWISIKMVKNILEKITNFDF